MKKHRSSFQPVVVNARPGESAASQKKRFATELVEGLMCDGLWSPDGSRRSNIVIQKEIWVNVNGKGDGRGNGVLYPVFHVFNYMDPSKAFSPDSGCRVNHHRAPFLTLRGAMRVAKEHFEDALASGEWVPVDKVKN